METGIGKWKCGNGKTEIGKWKGGNGNGVMELE